MESSRYQPPVRRSLSDEELAKKVNEATSSHDGMEAVMDLLVAQEALRAQEDAELEAWVEQMEAEGSAEAIAALAKFQGKDFVPQTDQIQFANPVETEEQVSQGKEPEQFSWFTKPEESEPIEEAPVEPEIEAVVEVIEIIEEVSVAEELTPEGTETPTDFERLLTAAAAEEEATAIEDKDAVDETGPANLVVPGDEHRNRKPISQLLVWLGASAVLTPMLFSLVLFGLGLSAQSVIVDLTVGYLASGALIATAALAGKRSGLSTAVISRAVFGVWGNSFPLSLLTISRLILSAVILALLPVFVDGLFSQLLPFDTVLTNLGGVRITAGYLFGLVVLAIVLAVSLLRGKASRITLLILSLSAFAALLVSLIGMAQRPLSFASAGIGFVSSESLAAIALIIAVQLLLWVELAPNLSKAVPMKPRGVKVFLAVLASQALIPLIVSILGYAFIAGALTSAVAVDELGPIRALVTSLPTWASSVLIVAVVISLIYAGVLSLKSLSLDLIALVRIRSRVLSTTLAVFLVSLVQLWFVQQPELRTVEYLLNISVLAGILSSGWIGMFIADVAVRKIAYHELSLNRAYGFYGKFNILSLVVWFTSVGLALVFVPVNLMGLEFTGLLAERIGLDQSLGSQALTLCSVVLFACLLTVLARIPQIRKQEKEVLAVESRREQLNDIFIGQE